MDSDSAFKSWQAFSDFDREVRRNRRYVRTPSADDFLNAVRKTVALRKARISKGRGFWRAQVGHVWRHLDEIGEEIPAAFPPDRMRPLADRATEGRANPKGIPMLYLCSSKDAAMSEVRPWLGSMVSLAHFEIQKDLVIADCSRNTEPNFSAIFKTPSPLEWDNVVWSDIDRAFTTPVTRGDDSGDYVATQILVELFRDEGFDGIAYRSAFGERSTNLALFDLDSAALTGCQLHEVSSVKMNFRERDNPYWINRSRKRSKKRSS